jgi:putative Holliday junction resolvase
MAAALAIDFGDKKSGFAVTDGLRIVAEPLGSVRTPGDGAELLEHVAHLLAERDVDTLVVGLPLNMDGSEGPRALATRRFMARLAARFPQLAVVAQDERLSSVEAEELLRDAGHRGRHRRERRDSFSALVILRDWLAGN